MPESWGTPTAYTARVPTEVVVVKACIGRWAPTHLPSVVYTRRVRDLFRRRYWVRCWQCDLALGPFPDRGFARSVEASLDLESVVDVLGDVHGVAQRDLME